MGRCLLQQLLVPMKYCQILLYILDSILHILAGAHAPSNHAIGQDILLHFGTQVTFLNIEVGRQGHHTHIRCHLHISKCMPSIKHHHQGVFQPSSKDPCQHDKGSIPNDSYIQQGDDIQGSHNECMLPSLISKFWTKHSPDLFSDWSCQVIIINVSHLDIHIIQSIQG
jgi:hypothetical protein